MNHSRGFTCYLALLVVLACMTMNRANAQRLPIEGRWAGGDTAAESIYGILTIKRSTIFWGDSVQSRARCVGRYKLEQDDAGKVYRDVQGKEYIVGAPQSPTTFLLDVRGVGCKNRPDHLRLSFPLGGADYMAMVEYEQGTPVGYMHFHRRP